MLKLLKYQNGKWKPCGDYKSESDLSLITVSDATPGLCLIAVSPASEAVSYYCNNSGWQIGKGKIDGLKQADFNKFWQDTQSKNQLAEVVSRIRLNNLAGQLNEAAPQAGLFWIDRDTGEVHGDGVKLRDAEIMGQGTANTFAVHPSSHYDLWPYVTSENRKWQGVQYEDVPRGRVVIQYGPVGSAHKIHVYMSPELEHPDYEAAVRNFFKLPGTVEFHYDDPHYDLMEI